MTPKRTNKDAVPEPFTKARQDDGILISALYIYQAGFSSSRDEGAQRKRKVSTDVTDRMCLLLHQNIVVVSW